MGILIGFVIIFALIFVINGYMMNVAKEISENTLKLDPYQLLLALFIVGTLIGIMITVVALSLAVL